MAPPNANLDRTFETTFGHLTVKQMPKIDWSDKLHVENLFPLYKREQIKMEKEKMKVPKVIDIDDFDLYTPTKDRMLFKGASLQLEAGKRCAVYGENGTGKTMLFHAMATGEMRDFPKSVSVHHMQEMSMDPKADSVSVIDTVISSHPLRRVLAVCEEILTMLVEAKKNPDKQEGLESNLTYVKQLMTQIDGYTALERASRMLVVLGFDKKGEASLMSSLSGGLRMRVALASAFFISPQVLLLDEPTNHLDLPSVLWLENQLRSYKSGSYLLVTHDRHLLNNVVTSVMQLQDLDIVPFTCGFAEFEKKRAKNDVDRDIKIEKFLAKNRNIDPCSPLYRTKMGYVQWQVDRQKREVAMKGKFTFKPPKALPNPTGCDPKDISLIKVDNVRFSYDEAKGLPFIFDTPISYDITMGTRLGIMGPNGAGKSTLLKLVTEKIFPTSGKITVNKDFVLAYFGQHSTKELLMEDTAFEFMQKSFPKAKDAELKSHLAKTGVDTSAMEKRMAGLSFSQRSCVIFAKLTFVPPHLLIMDEPTNFLDLDSVDALIRAANKFAEVGGALITVTHNRDFLKKCSEKFLSITPGAFTEYDNMKDAERATYSFIEALEQGKAVDHKSAIQENRGGGAIHTEEYLAGKEAFRKKQEAAAAAEAAAQAETLAAEEAKAAAIAEKAAKKRLSKREDWEKGETCWACVNNVWIEGTIVQNVRSIGCTVEKKDGSTILIQPLKLKGENPDANKGAAGAPGGARGGRGGTNKGAPAGRGGKGAGGKGGNTNKGGKGQAAGGRGGARGGARGGRGRGGY